MLGRKEKLYQFFPVFLSLSCPESHYYYSSLLLSLPTVHYAHEVKTGGGGMGKRNQDGGLLLFTTTTYFYLMRSIIIHSSFPLANYFKQRCRTHTRCNAREREEVSTTFCQSRYRNHTSPEGMHHLSSNISRRPTSC